MQFKTYHILDVRIFFKETFHQSPDFFSFCIVHCLKFDPSNDFSKLLKVINVCFPGFFLCSL